LEDSLKLNMLAINSQNGCVKSLWQIKTIFWPMIAKMSEEIWFLVNNQISFEECCEKHLEDAVKRFDPQKGSFEVLVRMKFYQAKMRYLKRGRFRRRFDSYDEIKEKEDSPIRNFVDALAGVEEKVLFNEKIALLAEGDQRRLLVLTAWKHGYNDSEAASLLAQRYGGKTETHRTYIKRLRTRCQKALSKAI
jgi:hypothetical protein